VTVAIEVIEKPAAAAAALGPLRARLLAELREPASAAELAGRLGIARQKVNYHLRELERHGLVRVVEERRHGGIVERVVEATAGSYALAPAVLGASGADPARAGDRLSAGYLVALAARAVGEVGRLLRRVDAGGPRVATLALDTEIGFAGPAAAQRFAAELAEAVTRLVAEHHADGGAPYRVLVAAHPKPEEEAQ